MYDHKSKGISNSILTAPELMDVLATSQISALNFQSILHEECAEILQNAGQLSLTEACLYGDLLRSLGVSQSDQLAKDIEQQAGLMAVDIDKREDLYAGFLHQANVLNANKEVIDSGLSYPVALAERFIKYDKAAVKMWNSFVENPHERFGQAPPLKPAIRTVGYGSLQSAAGRAESIEGVNDHLLAITDSSAIYDGQRTYLIRELTLPSGSRGSTQVKEAGLSRFVNSALVRAELVTADKDYDSSKEFGVSLLPPLVDEQFAQLADREMAYMLLPGPPVLNSDGTRCETTLICWPQGRSLLDSGYTDHRGERNEHSKKAFAKSVVHKIELQDKDNPLNFSHQEIISYIEAEPEERKFIFNELLQHSNRSVVDEEITVQRAVMEQLVDRFAVYYTRDLNTQPNAAYVFGSWLNFGVGDPELIEHALQTTSYVDSSGELVSATKFAIDITQGISYLGRFVATQIEKSDSQEVDWARLSQNLKALEVVVSHVTRFHKTADETESRSQYSLEDIVTIAEHLVLEMKKKPELISENFKVVSGEEQLDSLLNDLIDLRKVLAQQYEELFGTTF